MKKIYPDGIHNVIAAGLREQGFDDVGTATLDQPEHGLTDEVLASTDVMLWWGHMAHGEVSDEIVDKVQQRVLEGMGLIVLHSAHFSKIFKRLMGTTCNLKWREIGEKERVWVVNPAHPIADGLERLLRDPARRDVRRAVRHPGAGLAGLHQLVRGRRGLSQRLLLVSRAGKVFYFRPGHETFPIYYQTGNPAGDRQRGQAGQRRPTAPQIPVENVKVPLEPVRSQESE